jgi:hypothetical protein
MTVILTHDPQTSADRGAAMTASNGVGMAIMIVVALSGAATASAGPLGGTFVSTMGTLQVTEAADGTVTATIVDPKNPCGIPRGTAVLRGMRLDDSVAGSLKTCKFAGDGCSGMIEGETILLITKNGAQLSGTAHFETGGCKTPLGEAITMKKASIARAPAPPRPKAPDVHRAEALAREAQPLLQAGNAEEARKLCQEAVKIDPAFSQGHTCVGVSFYLRERYEEALEQYKKALEADPGNRDVYYNIGCVHAIQGRTSEALDYLKLALLNGYVDVQTLTTDSDLKNLNGNPLFEQLKSGRLE